MLGFEESGKQEYPEKNLSQQGREQTTNSTESEKGSRVGFVVGSRLCSERFSVSGYSSFTLSSKNTSKFQFDLESVAN